MAMQYVYNWDDLESEFHGLPTSLCKIKSITGDNLQLIWAIFEKGGVYEMHSHPHEQFSVMLQGRMMLHVGGEEKEIGPGDMWYAPPNVTHGGKLLADWPIIFVDIFNPIREDCLAEMRGYRAKRLGISEDEVKLDGPRFCE